ALAIDERRRPFTPTLWRRQADAPPEQALEQVWFAGVHSDVGGGYRDPALSEIPLLWIVDRARSCGLAFDPASFRRTTPPENAEQLRRRGTWVAPDPFTADIHESRTGFFRLLPPYARPIGEDGRGTFDPAADGQLVAWSAEDRLNRPSSGYRPP